jgi:hypothetical protein
MSIWILAVVGLSPIFVWRAVARNQARIAQQRSAAVELEVDALGVRLVRADGREEQVDWAEVKEVEVLTAKWGPHAPSGGVVILWCDEERGCLVPISKVYDSGVAEALTRLPGFDIRKLVAAIDEKPPKLTRVW